MRRRSIIAVSELTRKPTRGDGYRVWGTSFAAVEEGQRHGAWLRRRRPSDAVCAMVAARGPDCWLAFRQTYLKELTFAQAAKACDDLYRLANKLEESNPPFFSHERQHNTPWY